MSTTSKVHCLHFLRFIFPLSLSPPLLPLWLLSMLLQHLARSWLRWTKRRVFVAFFYVRTRHKRRFDICRHVGSAVPPFLLALKPLPQLLFAFIIIEKVDPHTPTVHPHRTPGMDALHPQAPPLPVELRTALHIAHAAKLRLNARRACSW